MYNTGVWPEDWMRSVLIRIEKRQEITKCDEHRTISLVIHASKVILHALTNRIEPKAKAFISNDQFGFQKGVGTREAIAVMRFLSERCIDHNQDIYVRFVDYEKAFDRVDWSKLLETHRTCIGVDWHNRRLIAPL